MGLPPICCHSPPHPYSPVNSSKRAHNGWSLGEEIGEGIEGDGEGTPSLGICWPGWRQSVQMEGYHRGPREDALREGQLFAGARDASRVPLQGTKGQVFDEDLPSQRQGRWPAV